MDDSRALVQQIYLIADELRGSATLSKHFAASVYEQERADQVRHLAARLASLVNPAPPEILDVLFDDDGWARASPAIGAEVVVLNDAGEVLLCQRSDNQRWCLPGGIAEIGESTTEAALRELWEEAGLRGEVIRLVGLFDGPQWGSQHKVHMVNLVYQVRVASGRPSPGTEMLDAKFFAADELPSPMHPGHELRVPYSLELIGTGRTHHDPASSVARPMPMHQRPAQETASD